MGWESDGSYTRMEPVCAWCRRPVWEATGGMTTAGDWWDCPRCGPLVPVRYARVTQTPDGRVERRLL